MRCGLVLFLLLGACGFRSSTLLESADARPDAGPDARHTIFGDADAPEGDAELPIDAQLPIDAPRPIDEPPEGALRLQSALRCDLSDEVALAGLVRMQTCRTDGPYRRLGGYIEAWEVGLLSGLDFPVEAGGCATLQCAANSSTCEAYQQCIDALSIPADCRSEALRCDGSQLYVCDWRQNALIPSVDCADYGATCGSSGCQIGDDCWFGASTYYSVSCEDNDLTLCGGSFRTPCSAVSPSATCESFAVGGEAPTSFCSVNGSGYGAYDTEVECSGGRVSFTSTTTATYAFDCLANGYRGCSEEGCVP
ncbi:MAG: hypothetical protein AAGF12_30780 [Myxococcota bacterium]